MKKFLTAIKNKIIKLGVNPTPEIISTPKQVSLWRRWTWINQAVYNPLSPDYHYGQNLEIGFRDFNDFDNYIRTHLGEPQGEFKYLNRIDQTKGWIPGNLRWANGKQMGSNHPNYNINIKYQGECRILKEWAEIVQLPYNTLRVRLNRGWDVTRAFTTPINTKFRKKLVINK